MRGLLVLDQRALGHPGLLELLAFFEVRLRRLDLAGRLLDHEPQLGLVIDTARPLRHFNRRAGADHRSRRLDEDERLLGQRLVLLGRVILVVQPDAHDLGRCHGREQAQAVLRDLRTVAEFVEDVAVDQPPASFPFSGVERRAAVFNAIETCHRTDTVCLLECALALCFGDESTATTT